MKRSHCKRSPGGAGACAEKPVQPGMPLPGASKYSRTVPLDRGRGAAGGDASCTDSFLQREPARSPAATRRAILSGAVLAAVLLLAGCGIPSQAYLPPPTAGPEPLAGVESIFTFNIPPDNNPDLFQGFELYYKLYAYDTSLQLPTGVSDPDTESSNITSIANLTQSQGFYRLYSQDEVASATTSGGAPTPVPPLIPVTSSSDKTDTALQISVDFSDPNAPLVEYSSSAYSTISVGRYVPVSINLDGPFLGFSYSDFTVNDPDLPSYIQGQSGALDTHSFYLALYVLSYGLDPTTFVNLYSDPVYLGYIQLFAAGSGGTQ